MSANYEQTGIGTNVEFGKNGPRIKDSSGTFHLRDNADAAFADLVVNDLTISGVAAIGGAIDTANPLTIYMSSGVERLSLTGVAGTANTYLEIDAPADRRAEIEFRSGGSLKAVMGRGDSDELGDDIFYIAATSNDATPPFQIDMTTGNVSLSDNLTLNSGSPTLTIGDTAGNPKIRLVKGATNIGSLSFRLATSGDTANDKRVVQDSGEDLDFEHYNGASWDTALTVDNSADVIIANDLTLDSAGATFTQGDGSASIVALWNKGASSNLELTFQQNSLNAWILRHDASEDLLWRRYIAGSFQDNAFTIANATGLVTLSNSLTLGSSGPTLKVGNFGGSAGQQFLKAAASGASIQFFVTDFTTANAKQFIHGTDETLKIQNWNGASWDTALTIDNNADVLVANDLMLDSASPVLTIGDGTSNPQGLRVNKSVGGTGTLFDAQSAGDRDWLLQWLADEDLTLYRYVTGVLQEVALEITNAGGDMTLRRSFIGQENLTLDSASPDATVGDASGSPRLRLRKTAAGTSEVDFFSAATVQTNDKRAKHENDETLKLQNYNGATWDTALTIDNSANVQIANDLTVAGTGRFDANGLTESGSPTTDLANKLFRISVRPYTNADGAWRALTGFGSVSANSLRLGGDSGVESSTEIQFWTATAVNTAGTSRGTITNAGLFNWLSNITMDSGSSTFRVGNASGSPTQWFAKGAGGTSDLRFAVATSGDTTNDKRIIHDTDETWKVQNWGGVSWSDALTVDNSADVLVENQLLVAGAAAGDGPAGALDVIVGAVEAVDHGISIVSTTECEVNFTDVSGSSIGGWLYQHSGNTMLARTGGAARARFDSNGISPQTNGVQVLGITSRRWGESHINQIVQTETGTPPTTVAGDGAYWTRADTPSTAMFTDGAGDDHPLSLMQILNGSPKCAFVPGSAAATFLEGSSGEAGRAYLRYSASATNSAYWRFVMPRDYTGNGVTVRIHYFGSSNFGATDTVKWSVGFERHVNGLVTSSTSFGTFTNLEIDPGTLALSVLTSADITVASAGMDGILKGESFMITVDRLGADPNDDYTGTTGVLGMEILQAA